MALSDQELNGLYNDALLRRQIYLQGYSTSLTRQIERVLDATEADLERVIRDRLAKLAGEPTDLGAATTARLQLLRKAIADLRGDGFDAAADLWNDQLERLGVVEAASAKNSLDDIGGDHGVAFEAILPQAEKLAALVAIKPFEGKLMADWAESLQASDLDAIMNSITIGLTRGDTIDQIVRRVIGSSMTNGRDGIAQLTRNNLASITRTAVNTISNASRREFFKFNDDIFDNERFVATLDAHTTPICRATDGTVSPVGEGPQPPLHWGCRSIVVAMIGKKLGGQRPAVGDEVERVDANETYATFLARQSAEFQGEVLGQTKAKLFRDGGLTLNKFVARDGHEFTLDELARREPKAFRRAGVK